MRTNAGWPDQPSIRLSNGVLIPQLGYGTYKLGPDETVKAVRTALDVGYRHIDTAAMYRNELEVGAAIAQSGIPREEVFVTTKLNNAFHRYDDALAAFDRSLNELGMDYVDLYLIHWPLPQVGLFQEAWHALEELYASGRARAIGVSNFQPDHLKAIFDSGEVIPAVNQIEMHPYLQQNDVRAFDAAHGIVTEAWSPLGRRVVLDDPIIALIAAEYGVTPAQVVIRWHLQRGDVVIPKSVTPSRIASNFNAVGFELAPNAMALIDALDRGQRTGSHPDHENRTDR